MHKKANYQPSTGGDTCWKQIDTGGDSQKTSPLLIIRNAVLDVLSINNEKYSFVNFADLESDKTKVVISQTTDEVLEVLESLGELNLKDGIKYFNLGIVLFKIGKFKSSKKFLLQALEKGIPKFLKETIEKYVTFCDVKLLLENSLPIEPKS